MRRGGCLPVSIAAAAVVVLAAPSAASAAVEHAGGYSYVTKSFQAKGNKAGVGSAACPRGTHVVGGGERNTGPFGSIVLRQTFPYDSKDADSKPDDGWKVRVRNDKAKTVLIRVQAICGDTEVRYVTVRFVASANTQAGQVTATCPAGNFAYSGGVAAPANSKIYLNSAFPSDPSGTGATGWGAYVDNPTSNAEDSAAIIAVCGKSKPSIADVTQNGIPSHTRGRLTPACAPARHAIGGGQDNSTGFKGLAVNTLSAVPHQGKLGRAWRTAVDIIGASSVRVTAFVVCGKSLG